MYKRDLTYESHKMQAYDKINNLTHLCVTYNLRDRFVEFYIQHCLCIYREDIVTDIVSL